MSLESRLKGFISKAKSRARTLIVAPVIAAGLLYASQAGVAGSASAGPSYGCSHNAIVHKTPGPDELSQYDAEVSFRFYQNRTGIMIKPGYGAMITSEGWGCLNNKACGNPDGIENVMWPMEAALRDIKTGELAKTKVIGRDYKIENDTDKEYELVLLIPDGPTTRTSCSASDYRNNTGRAFSHIFVYDLKEDQEGIKPKF